MRSSGKDRTQRMLALESWNVGGNFGEVGAVLTCEREENGKDRKGVHPVYSGRRRKGLNECGGLLLNECPSPAECCCSF